MNPPDLTKCRGYLARLAAQLDYLMPPPRGVYGEADAPIPLERLPTVAALVREYIECEAILAGLQSNDTQQTDG